jgi:hypothetical protein
MDVVAVNLISLRVDSSILLFGHLSSLCSTLYHPFYQLTFSEHILFFLKYVTILMGNRRIIMADHICS